MNIVLLNPQLRKAEKRWQKVRKFSYNLENLLKHNGQIKDLIRCIEKEITVKELLRFEVGEI